MTVAPFGSQMESEVERSGQKLGGLEKAKPAELGDGELFSRNRGQGTKGDLGAPLADIGTSKGRLWGCELLPCEV